MAAPNLRSCPFCGHTQPRISEDDLGFARWVYCPECEADGPPINYRWHGTKEESRLIVVGQWNGRTKDHIDYEDGKRELRDLLKLICPQIEPLESLSGMVSQINNFIAGMN